MRAKRAKQLMMRANSWCEGFNETRMRANSWCEGFNEMRMRANSWCEDIIPLEERMPMIKIGHDDALAELVRADAFSGNIYQGEPML